MPDEKEYQVYISGIRRGSCYPETEVNCINAKELANKIRKELKVEVFCPHDWIQPTDDIFDHSEKFENELNVLSKCKYMISVRRNDSAKISMTSIIENKCANEHDVQIFNSYEDLKDAVINSIVSSDKL